MTSTKPIAIAGSAVRRGSEDTSQRTYPMRFTWKAEWGGDHVAVKGEFDQWGEQFDMKRAGDGLGDLEVVIRVPAGTYSVKYLVNNEWRLAPNQPTRYDDSGNLNNVVVVDAAAIERTQSLFNIAKHSFAKPEAKPLPGHDEMSHHVIEYVERDEETEVAEGVSTSHLPGDLSRVFDVIVSPSMIHSPHSPSPRSGDEQPSVSDGLKSIPQVSSYNMLVDMTVKQVTDANPAMESLSHRIRDGFKEAFEEQTKTLLQKAKHQLKTAEQRKICLDPVNTHPHLSLDHTGMTVTKKAAGGSYRSCRARQPIQRGANTYFEVLFEVQSKAGGICIGLDAGPPRLDQLVGTTPNSLGLYSTGDAVVEGTWTSYAGAYQQGSVVGVLVRSVVHDDDTETITCIFIEDGKPKTLSGGVDKALTLQLPAGQSTYPAITLYTSRTKVTLCPVSVDFYHAQEALTALAPDEEVVSIGGELLDSATLERAQAAVSSHTPPPNFPALPTNGSIPIRPAAKAPT